MPYSLNVKQLFYFYFTFFLTTAYAVDFGTGSEGTCTDGAPDNTFAANNNARTYNCTNVIINGTISFNTGGSAPIILATNSIQINGTININGGTGVAGSNDPNTAINGGAAGAGASPGGAYLGSAVSYSGQAGNGPGAGSGGQGFSPSGTDQNGGGGGGASYGSSGTNGQTVDGTGGTAGAINRSIGGGSGGGAGGSGEAFFSNFAPATGGGGGGALVLRAKSDITISGTINAIGGDGGVGDTASGSGGGGSGGSLLVQAVDSVDLTSATINLSGGLGGVGGGANGGNGGMGRIRLESASLSQVYTSGLTKVPVSLKIELAELFDNEFEGKIATGCGSVDLSGGSSSSHWNFILAFLIAFALPAITKLKTKGRHS